MKDPTKTKTPTPTGATEIVRPTVNEDTAFSHFDMLDLQAIGMAQLGKPVDRMVYQWGNKSKSGWNDCKFGDGTPVPDNILKKYPCKYKGKDNHIHITGVGWFGIRYIKSKMWGIGYTITRPKPLRASGQLFFECTAKGYDKLTGSDSEIIMLVPQSKVAHMQVQHQFIATQTFAKRNAIAELFDPTCMQSIENIIRDGRESINEDDITRVFGPMLVERKALQQLHMRTLAEGRQTYHPQMPAMAHRDTPALPEGETTQEATSDPESETGGFPGTNKQKHALKSMIVKGTDLKEDEALAFIADNIQAYETVQEYYDAFKSGNFEDVAAWINKPKGDDNE